MLNELFRNPLSPSPNALIPVITVVNPCRRDLTLANRGVRIAVTDLTLFLPIRSYGDSHLSSFAHFTPQPRHYGTLLANCGNHKSGKINGQHNSVPPKARMRKHGYSDAYA
ncbi:hypothetical protein PIB30_017618 [Stylosanthes scabra]|uniref:Uncharacterized protein n=1 Tax=Stylosanthes scabra TaxID=79078 RepID=A0ABU6V5W6_9FABA|nr:hypothetical protein [Stylosanthes scabra]